MYKKETISGIRFDLDKYHEDVFWSCRAIGNASKVSIIDYVGYFYFQRNNSIMGKRYFIDWLDQVEEIDKQYDYIKDKFPGLESIARLSVIKNCIYHGQMALIWLSEEEKKKAFDYLNIVRGQFHFSLKDFSSAKFTHSIWVLLSGFSLYGTCLLKNFLRVGI